MEREENSEASESRLDFATVQSTYKIITVLLEQIDASSSLISMLASALGEEATRRITETLPWADYMQSRKALEAIRPELERFAATAVEIINKKELNHEGHEDN
jgi:hypothetical protein